MDREKVIKGLELCTNISQDGCLMLCPYKDEKDETYSGFCEQVLKQDALALLKEQEAKCLTKAELDDLNENQFVWIEGRAGIYLYCLQIIGICLGRTGVSDIQFNTPTCYIERSTDTYGIDYRIWTDKPTEEQSQAVKWE